MLPSSPGATLQQQIAFWQSIANWLIANPDALRPALHRDFLPILDHLRRAPDTPGNTAMRQFWMGLAIAVGFSEPGMRAELQQTRRMARGNRFVGCGWVRCPMYDQECVGETFRCGGCQRKMYCALMCQKRLGRVVRALAAPCLADEGRLCAGIGKKAAIKRSATPRNGPSSFATGAD